MKKILKNLIKFYIFILIGILPFITITQLVGIEIFLDSFENSKYYVCLQDEDDKLELDTKNGEYIIIQKSSHPDFEIKNLDSIIYYENNGELTCDKFNDITIGAINRFYIENEDITSQPIHESQIVGKIINVIEGNIWNSISIKMWETSINSLNLGAIFAYN